MSRVRTIRAGPELGGLWRLGGRSELHHPRFVDLAWAEVYATLLDEGRYLGSLRTIYRVLAAAQEVRERRHQSAARGPHAPSCSPPTTVS